MRFLVLLIYILNIYIIDLLVPNVVMGTKGIKVKQLLFYHVTRLLARM